MTAFSAKKDRHALADLLLAIEAGYDVNAITVDGVRLWPIVRIVIGNAFKRSDASVDAGFGSSANASTEERSAATAISQPVDEFPANSVERSALRSRYRKLLVERGASELRRLAEEQTRKARALRGTDFLVLSKVEKYHQKIGAQRYAPVLDPVFDDLRDRGTTAILGLEPIPFACVNEPHRIDAEPYLLTTRFSRPLFRRLWQRRPFEKAAHQLRQINEFIAQTQPDYCFQVDEVLRRYRVVAHWAGFFAQVFEVISPKCIFLSSFTGWLHAVLAARSLGIPTVDIQHGGQARFHHPTTHFSNLPREGYEVMPDVFWLWGEMNLEYASQWLPGRAARHVLVVGGNRNIAHWYKRRDGNQLDPADNAYVTRFHGRPIVLITLSYGVDRLLPGALVEAMCRVKEVEWHVRLHPTHRTKEVVEQIRAHLEGRGCASLFIEEPTHVQLPSALSVSVAHITPFSTAGIEAVAMGVPTLIAHPIGARLLQNEIDAGIFSFAENADGIERWVRAVTRREGVDEAQRRRFVETDDGAVDRVLEVASSVRSRRPFARGLRYSFTRPRSR